MTDDATPREVGSHAGLGLDALRPVAHVQIMGSYRGAPALGCLLSLEAEKRIKVNDPLYDRAALLRVLENAKAVQQRKRHSGECEHDQYSREVCERMYAEKCDDVIGLCEALRAVLALAGENKEVRRVIEKAIHDHGGPDVA